MEKLNNLQKALLKNVLKNYKRGLVIWIKKEELSLPDKITIFFEMKTGIDFEGMKPKKEKSIDFQVEFDIFIDQLISDIETGAIKEKNIMDISFMLENQNWMPESKISDEVIDAADFPFPEYIEKNLML